MIRGGTCTAAFCDHQAEYSIIFISLSDFTQGERLPVLRNARKMAEITHSQARGAPPASIQVHLNVQRLRDVHH